VARATITLIDRQGKHVIREVEDACFDGDCLLHIYEKGAMDADEVINMRSPEFCSVKFYPRATQIKEGPCAVVMVRGMS
jgi:hypothetical protein